MNALKLTASALAIVVAGGLASPAFAADAPEKPKAADMQKSTAGQKAAGDVGKAGAGDQGSIVGVRASIEEAQAAIEADDLDKAEQAVKEAKRQAEASGVDVAAGSAQGGDAKGFGAEIDRAQKALAEDDAETASEALTAANAALDDASGASGAGTTAGKPATSGGAMAKGAMDDKALQGEKAAGASDQAKAPSLADKNAAAAGAGGATPSVQGGAAQNSPSPNGVLVSDLLGKDVKNSSGESVGELEDVVYDEKKLTHFVISVGGFLGIGEKDVALPASEVQLSDGQVTIRGQMTEDMLKEMPPYEPEKFTPSERESRIPASEY